MKRRELLKTISLAGAGVVAAPMINRGRFRLFAALPVEYSARAIDLVQKSLVIDMLNPFTVDPSSTWLSNPDSFTSQDLQTFKDSGISILNLGGGGGGPNALLRNLRFMAEWNGFVGSSG